MSRSAFKLALLLVTGLTAGCGEDVDGLVTDLASENPIVRQDAVIDAREYDAEDELVSAVEKLLGDPDRRIRREAVLTLYTYKSTTSVQPLIPLVNDPDPDIARAAIDTLGHLADPRAAPALMTLLTEQKGTPPLNAIWALGECRAPESRALLSELRTHDDNWVRYNVDEALRKLDE